MRVWLDDVRPMPDGFDVWVKTADEAIGLLMSGDVEFISFDHDLADEHYHGGGYCSPTREANGYTVAAWIEEAVRERRIKLPGWAVHSANPVGAKNIRAALESAERFA